MAQEFGKLLVKLGLKRPRLGFYGLRHSFRTAADSAGDRSAIDLIMGHSDPSMAAHYVGRIDDGRLEAVAEHVRSWLFSSQGLDPKQTVDARDNRRRNRTC